MRNLGQQNARVAAVVGLEFIIQRPSKRSLERFEGVTLLVVKGYPPAYAGEAGAIPSPANCPSTGESRATSRVSVLPESLAWLGLATVRLVL